MLNVSSSFRQSFNMNVYMDECFPMDLLTPSSYFNINTLNMKCRIVIVDKLIFQNTNFDLKMEQSLNKVIILVMTIVK